VTDRLPSDHPSIETVRATLARRGRTRSRLELPADDRFPLTTTRLVLDGDVSHTRIESARDDGVEINGAYGNVRLARERDGEDRLEAWRRAVDIDYGRSVLVDVVEPGFLYGVREPGERVVYEAVESPDEGLAAIARDLDDVDG
jgi:hypothetical protein